MRFSGDVPQALVGAQGVKDKQVTIPGDSGGAMISGGHLVAVHWGYRGANEDPRRCVHALGAKAPRLAQIGPHARRLDALRRHDELTRR